MSVDILALDPHEALNRTYNPDVEETPLQMIQERTFKSIITREHYYILDPEAMRTDRIVGDPTYDVLAMTAKMQAWVTIEHMLNIYHVGGYQSLCNPADKKVIYEIVTLHLKCCQLHNINVFTGEAVDIVTLSIFDEFLQTIYEDSLYELRHTSGSNSSAADRFEEALGGISNVDDQGGFTGNRNRLFSKETVGDDDIKTKSDSEFYDPFNFGGDDTWT